MEKRIRISLFIILLSLASLLIPYSMYVKEKNTKDASGTLEEVKGSKDISKYPAFQQIPPNTAQVGEPFEYSIQVVDKDTPRDELKFELVTAPDWMYIEKNRVYGTPTIYDLGENKVVVTVSDGENKVEELFYIVVLANED